jgi:hypothetical protein
LQAPTNIKQDLNPGVNPSLTKDSSWLWFTTLEGSRALGGN